VIIINYSLNDKGVLFETFAIAKIFIIEMWSYMILAKTENFTEDQSQKRTKNFSVLFGCFYG